MSLPLVLVVLDIYPLRRWPGHWRQWTTPAARAVLREKLPYAAMALAGGILAAVVVSRTLGVTSLTAYPMPARLAMAAYGLVFYLRATMVPAALSPLYELPARIELLDLPFLASAVAAVLITVALIAARRHWPAGLAAGAVYALTLGPVLGFVHNGPQLVADRYSYLACLSWALLLGGALVRQVEARAPDGRPRASARVALAAVAIWVAALATLTWNQTRVWKDTDAIWRQALEVDPNCARCHREWGAVLGNRGELERAIVHFRRAVELRPDRVSSHGNVGLALLKAGRPAEAVVHFARVLQDNPGDVDVRSRLGAALIQQGRLDEARVELERAVRDNPRHPDALTNLGLALLYLGRPTEARPYLERASTLAPASALPHVGLARAFLALGDGDAAARHAATARHLDPGLVVHMPPP
jgi:protein O-mannosyl-transferase